MLFRSHPFPCSISVPLLLLGFSRAGVCTSGAREARGEGKQRGAGVHVTRTVGSATGRTLFLPESRVLGVLKSLVHTVGTPGLEGHLEEY